MSTSDYYRYKFLITTTYSVYKVRYTIRKAMVCGKITLAKLFVCTKDEKIFRFLARSASKDLRKLSAITDYYKEKAKDLQSKVQNL